ncbi:helix-turn-helix transcriptional regulator [Terasakiella pusilla]|uniref:helix-turn-helix transcriptional regulator n=1 Tax=Terasakiella pusilla TaxID=64973 RepID=UPI003AA82790
MNTNISNTQKSVLRLTDILSLTGFKSRSTIWRKLRAGKFPEPIELGNGQIGWLESEVLEWISSRPRRTYK